MVTLAKIRAYEEGDRLPAFVDGKETHVELDPNRYFECWQPDSLLDDGYNLVIAVDQKVIRFMSIDFDFFGEEDVPKHVMEEIYEINNPKNTK